MAIGVGLGISRFPFDSARDYWRWVEYCELGGVDSIWQTDRLVSSEPMLECMSVMAALAGRTQNIRFGSAEDAQVARTMEALRPRLKSSPDRYLVAGDAGDMVRRIEEFIAAGCSKFVMLPMANGTRDLMFQTRKFIEEVQGEFEPR